MLPLALQRLSSAFDKQLRTERRAGQLLERIPWWMQLINVHIFLAGLWVVCGFSAAVCFGFVFKNYTAACWAVKYGNFEKWQRGLKRIMLLGCIGQLLGCSGMSSAISLAIILNTGALQVYGENHWLAVVWSFMTWKWSFFTFYYARKYRAAFKRLKNTKESA
ncbi:unnamed protein product [Soboliphyme baturini]|uniref:DNA-damage-inducible protein n=1 Tax=Soboliphyme baturini TaxID=241478 RepID=A0A183IWN0_9BILA|nr:unnamed protein product [Soboliphyme baturini]